MERKRDGYEIDRIGNGYIVRRQCNPRTMTVPSHWYFSEDLSDFDNIVGFINDDEREEHLARLGLES